ncbi:hypothetical protein IWQ47_003253 [Aquimarina sp. EL_43]|nr:hypothetical protein [Aquimarina sp. EL_35]MBG6149569.1 hypothetical protein [Aquimarina sp. EL_32]MBG6170168.1 hypothetical protein [Aquimarina sp. EL_43]
MSQNMRLLRLKFEPENDKKLKKLMKEAFEQTNH